MCQMSAPTEEEIKELKSPGINDRGEKMESSDGPEGNSPPDTTGIGNGVGGCENSGSFK